ncbi:MAG: nitrate- and nitrite sensing domain-containing protein [Micromonosporaceae bacterium]|nr:nitrate- and nitrite sensing domain-containing protein [Micromonosporaceae bacterium]
MSKRPAVRPASSRSRLSVGRLRDLPIWSKLGLIMIVPTIATVVVGSVGLVRNIESASDADRTGALAVLATEAGALVHEVQNERAAAILVLANVGGDSKTAFERQLKSTDTLAKSYVAQRKKSVGDLPDTLSERLARIDIELADLSRMREQILKGPSLAMTISTTRYTALIDDLLGIREDAAELSGADDLARAMRTVSALSTHKENVSVERVVILTALTRHTLSSVLRKDFQLAVTEQEQTQQEFITTATSWQRDQYNQFVIGPDLREAYKLRGILEGLIEARNGESVSLPSDIGFTAQQWDGALAGKSDLLRKAEVELDRSVINEANNDKTALWRQVLIETGVLLGMLLLAILFAWLVARSMARSLRELRHGALTLAQFGLPQAVTRLRDPALVAQGGSPQQIAEHLADPLPIRSRDEFGQVAEAFNAVHFEAVRTAAEQAVLRASVATMFVNLARRSQILVDRLIGHLDRLERGEEDPDRLGELFQLDHLATRMRRNDENLLVLAGADSTRIQREPASLMDVLRAAQSEVEHYTRIEFGEIDRDIEVGAHAVNDLVHLVAELLDNATAFSPPDSPVVVEAKRVGDRAALLVEDRGIGIAPDQLAEHNERLANPPVVDVAVSRMMGLVVVARLAARHGVRVELRAGRERGTIAELTLPVGVLAARALGGGLRGGQTTPSGFPVIGHGPAGQPSSPLALEPGPIGYADRPGDGFSGFGAPSSFPSPAQPPAQPSNGAFSGPPAPSFGRRPAPNGAQPPPPGARPTPMEPPQQRPMPDAPQWSQTPSQPPGQSRGGLPAWSDLTGINEVPRGPQNRGGLGGAGDTGRRTDAGRGAGDSDVTAIIPRQRSGLPQRPVGGPTVPPQPERPSVPVDQGPPAPPAWPPVPSQPSAPPPASSGQASGPRDMTAQMPAVRLDWEPSAEESQGSATSEQRFVDQTMELPIYRELESAWFSTRRSAPAPAPAAPAPAPTPVSSPPARQREAASQRPEVFPSAAPAASSGDAGVPAGGFGTGGTGSSAQTPAAATRPAWQTAADEGWQAAAALAEDRDFAMTETGLPKRVPMSQLVPGGVERAPVSSYRRTPEAVRGLLSAYHRGVQRGRTQHIGGAGDAKTPERSAAGPQTSQGGKEYEA